LAFYFHIPESTILTSVSEIIASKCLESKKKRINDRFKGQELY